MMNFFLSFLLLTSALLFNACISPKPLDDLALQKQILANEQKIAQMEDQISRQKQEMDYEKNRSEVLERENAALVDHLSQARNNIKDTFIALMGTFEKREEELFDCYIGYAPISRSRTFYSTVKTLLVDFGNPVEVDNVIICGAELYTQTPATVQFCVIRPAYSKPNTLVVEKISGEYKFAAAGKQKIIFPRKQRFSASKGSWLGVYINPAAGLAYDDKGTGKVLDFQLKKIVPMETVLAMPASLPGRDGKAISFRFFGSSYMN